MLRIWQVMGMNENNRNGRSRVRAKTRGPEWPKKMKMKEGAKFLGVTVQKMTSFVNNGTIKFELDPFDHRVKLVKRSDLEALQRQRAQVYGEYGQPG